MLIATNAPGERSGASQDNRFLLPHPKQTFPNDHSPRSPRSRRHIPHPPLPRQPRQQRKRHRLLRLYRHPQPLHPRAPLPPSLSEPLPASIPYQSAAFFAPPPATAYLHRPANAIRAAAQIAVIRIATTERAVKAVAVATTSASPAPAFSAPLRQIPSPNRSPQTPPAHSSSAAAAEKYLRPQNLRPQCGVSTRPVLAPPPRRRSNSRP